MTTFLLIRHGHTEAVDRYLAGTAAGTPLDEAGRLQVEALAGHLRSVPLTAVVSSPLERTVATAASIAAAHGLEVEIDPAFIEFEVGSWTGRPWTDLDRDPEWVRFNRTRSLVRAPAGELTIDVQHRAVSGLLRIGERAPDGVIAIVSHADVIKAVLMYFLGIPIDFIQRFDILPASISVVTLDDRGAVVRGVNGRTVRDVPTSVER